MLNVYSYYISIIEFKDNNIKTKTVGINKIIDNKNNNIYNKASN